MGTTYCACHSKKKQPLNLSYDSKLTTSLSESFPRMGDPSPSSSCDLPLSPSQEMTVRNAILSDSANRFYELCRSLGISPNQMTLKGTRLLHEAAAKGSAQVVRFLCRQGAAVDM